MLNLPSNFQLVGAVFVESAPPSRDGSANDLTPSMDREGFLDNDAFKALVDTVRGGLEFLAQEDKKQLQKDAETRAEQAMRETRADLRAAVEYVKSSPTPTHIGPRHFRHGNPDGNQAGHFCLLILLLL